MQAWEEKALGEQKAREAGRIEGRIEGQERLNQLYAVLLKQGRAADITRAIEDKEYLEVLYKEMKLR